MSQLQVQNPVESLLGLLSDNQGRTLVALAGLPGGGKSTLATLLVDRVNALTAPGTAVALGMDGYHFPKATLRQMPDPEAAFARRGAPYTFDVQGLAARLKLVKSGYQSETVFWPEFEHAVGDPAEDATSIPPEARLVLVEGLYLLQDSEGWSAVRSQFDIAWYLDTPFEVALERLIRRHQQAWNISREAALERVAKNDRLNALTVLESRPNADALIVDRSLEAWNQI